MKQADAAAHFEARPGPTDQTGDAPAQFCLSLFELDPRKLELISMVAQGSTAMVFRGKFRGEVVAVKQLMLTGQAIDEKFILAFTRELEVWPRVRHEHILRFIGLISQTPPLRLISEFCEGGSLFDLLHNQWHIKLTWSQRLRILVDTASAVEYLHSFATPILHRDLKSLNVLLAEPVEDEGTVPMVKVADFGFARTRAQNAEWAELTRGAGTSHWMAPEVAAGGQYNEKSDVFSFAIVTYEVVCRHMANEDLDPAQAIREIMSGMRPSLRSPDLVPPDTPLALLALLKQCWDQAPERRPTGTELHGQLRSIQDALGG